MKRLLAVLALVSLSTVASAAGLFEKTGPQYDKSVTPAQRAAHERLMRDVAKRGPGYGKCPIWSSGDYLGDGCSADVRIQQEWDGRGTANGGV